MNVDYDEATGVATFRPQGPLSKADFIQAAATVDPIIAERGGLAGLVICTASFPGWESLAALIAHLRFIHDHHRKIGRVALVTDSALGTLGEKIADHFVVAQIRHFPYAELDDARRWAAG